jgi:crotonobetainyl-CoA:carnitine CoA-transferase CaiB-like acyl-CoA transferase
MLPLKGIRVIDATTSWAGAYLTNVLATFGAETIKVESVDHLDVWRGGGTFAMDQKIKIWECSPLWNSVNSNKFGITLDLGNEKGREVYKKLVKTSDIVVENFTHRVMENFKLDYPHLIEINPELIMISLPAYGGTGPLKNVPGFATPIEMMSGFAYLMGYPDKAPTICGTGFTDAIAGTNGVIAVMFAMLYRQLTGTGQYIDLSQVEAATSLIGDTIADYSVNKHIQTRRANEHPYMAPHGYYRCKGDEMWVGIAIASDDEWASFCKAIGEPAWTQEGKYSDTLQRWQNRSELDVQVEEWTSQHDHIEVMNTLQKVGVAAGPYFTSVELLNDPHIKERGVFQYVDRAVAGRQPYLVPTIPMRLSDVSVTISQPAPLLGEHNGYVLGKILGMPESEIQDLEKEHIIGSSPLFT